MKDEIKYEELENPNYTILKKFFSNYMVNNINDIKGTIIDAFNSNNELTYNIQKYEDYPMMLKLEPLIKLYKKYGINKEGILAALKYATEIISEEQVGAIKIKE